MIYEKSGYSKNDSTLAEFPISAREMPHLVCRKGSTDPSNNVAIAWSIYQISKDRILQRKRTRSSVLFFEYSRSWEFMTHAYELVLVVDIDFRPNIWIHCYVIAQSITSCKHNVIV